MRADPDQLRAQYSALRAQLELLTMELRTERVRLDDIAAELCCISRAHAAAAADGTCTSPLLPEKTC